MIDPSSATVASVHSARPSARRGEVRRGRAGDAEDRAGLLVAAALDLVPARRRSSIVVAVIAFIVSVPVLSLLMTVVPPSVSTSVRDLTTAFDSASRCAPEDSIVCTNVGRPVGMADDGRRDAQQDERLGVLVAGDADDRDHRRPHAHARMPKTLVMPSSSRCSGDRGRFVAVTMSAIRPICVDCAGGGDDERRRAPGDLGVLEHHVRPVAERRLAGGERRGVLGDGRALPGERRLLHLERRRG